jgi:formate dehydrogenase gamma subunit
MREGGLHADFARIVRSQNGEYSGMTEERASMHTKTVSCGRFTVPQRIEHLVLALSFTVLGLTGLVQKYVQNSLSEWLIEMMGGIQSTRILHRAAAIVFSLLAVYHIIAVAYKIYVRRVPMTMIPSLKDIKDGLQLLGYNLFLKKNPPNMPRYNFAEKLEYWALVWGGIIMVLTGFMLWNPLITTAFLPGQFIPAAKAVHGAEAVLAVLAIVVWHMYNVHIKMFNVSMFTGKLTEHQMEQEHGAEWGEIISGQTTSESSNPARRRRQIVFFPIAILFAAGGVGTVYWTATVEATAIETLPIPISQPAVYSPDREASPLLTKAESVSAPLIAHPVEGMEQCQICHGSSKMRPVPLNHQGRPIESCEICHKPSPVKKVVSSGSSGAQVSGPKPIPHPTEADPYKTCTNCHGIGRPMAFPPNHSGYPASSCAACHK